METRNLSNIKKLENLADLLFLEPLYSSYKIELEPKYEHTVEDVGTYDNPQYINRTDYIESDDFFALRSMLTSNLNIYFYCPGCKKELIIKAEGLKVDNKFHQKLLHHDYEIRDEETFQNGIHTAQDILKERYNEFVNLYLKPKNTFSIDFTCTSPKEHKISIIFKLTKNNLIKVGQYPSIVDFEHNLISYKSILSNEDYKELKKAIGLKAHGNGIGSFVYLRRLFERLIHQKIHTMFRHDADLLSSSLKLHSNEKIDCVKELIPNFITDNPVIYKILSKGIHEFTEKDCLSYFETMKQAIIFMLEEEYSKKRREKLSKELSTDMNKIHETIVSKS
ncbi:hypothetical protein [Paenibacillus polymyxa]|uniref:hypothetical protein n=1 Tax=Paenibacillus polymyxa TaxID=1406 RepID=UPI00287FE689|nr:hypothetical protein [Paenibacillus polymyxa]